MRRTLTALPALLVLAAPPALAQDKADLLDTYADIAQAGYEDSLVKARELRAAVDALLSGPSADTLAAARQAWLRSRVP